MEGRRRKRRQLKVNVTKSKVMVCERSRSEVVDFVCPYRVGMMLATFSWSVFLQGWLKKDLSIVERIVFLAASICLIIEKSGTTLWMVMLAVNLAIIGWCIYTAKQAEKSNSAVVN